MHSGLAITAPLSIESRGCWEEPRTSCRRSPVVTLKVVALFVEKREREGSHLRRATQHEVAGNDDKTGSESRNCESNAFAREQVRQLAKTQGDGRFGENLKSFR